MTEPITHLCRSDKTCVARTSTGPAATVKPDTLCHGCVTRLQEQLDDLPTIRDVLRLYLVKGGSSAQTKVAFSSEPAAPMNLGVLDLLDEIDDILDRAAGLTVANLIRQPAQQFVIWSRGKRRMDYLDGVQRALHIRGAWKKADDIIGMSRPWQQRHARCPECDLRTLGNFLGSDTVQCSSCGYAMTRDDYESLCIITPTKKEA